MTHQTYTVGPRERTVCDSSGTVVAVPDGWVLLPPGDAALTRRVKAAGEYLLVEEARGRKRFSRGMWAPNATIEEIRNTLLAERETPEFRKRTLSDAARREKQQVQYVEDFAAAVSASELAERIAKHATPVGSGTVARTKRIPIEDRASAAIIAWLRHQTTGYDSMVIPRVKGKRREVRRMLAARSQELLHRYRRGDPIAPECPLFAALGRNKTC
jgi:hypothetical protein